MSKDNNLRLREKKIQNISFKEVSIIRNIIFWIDVVEEGKYNNNVIYPDKVRLNLEYYYNNSIWIDIKIIFATLSKILKF